MEPAPWLEMRSNGEELTWDGEMQWYQIIHKRGASNDFEVDFLASMNETAIPALVAIEDQMNDAVYIDNEQNAELEALSDAIFNMRSQIDSIHIENDGGPPSNEESLIIADLLNSIETASLNQYGIIQNLNSGNTTVLNELLSELNGLSVDQPQEITYNNYLKLVIGVALNGINNEANITLAQELSSLDEVENGPGARKASHFLPFDDYQEYVMAEVNICKGNHDEFQAPQDQVKSDSSKVWLLEQNGFRNYGLNYNGEQETDFLFFGINGNLLSSGKVVPGFNNYSFKDFPTGYYVFKLRNSTQIQRLFLEP